MPPPGSNREVDASAIPDFVAVAGDEGFAGYVSKHDLFPDSATGGGQPTNPAIPVYAPDLRTVAGHMIPGVGFVPLGGEGLAPPTIEVSAGPSNLASAAESTNLTLYVKNASGEQAWVAVHEIGAQGYAGIGVGCINVAVGEQLVLLDRPPQEAGLRLLRTIYRRAQAAERAVLWIEIDTNGAVSQGVGVPSWWAGDPQAC